MAHNLALVCVNNTLHAFGGQFRPDFLPRFPTQRGTFHTALMHSSIRRHGGKAEKEGTTGGIEEPLTWRGESWWRPQLVIDDITLRRTSCVELHASWSHAGCQFDGRFSSVFFQERVWLFGRANIHPNGGARCAVRDWNYVHVCVCVVLTYVDKHVPPSAQTRAGNEH